MRHGGPGRGQGRKKGIPNKVNADLRAALVERYGLTPLEYFFQIMCDKEQPQQRRDWAAAQAAPFVNARLASTVIEGNPNKPLNHKVEVAFVRAAA